MKDYMEYDDEMPRYDVDDMPAVPFGCLPTSFLVTSDVSTDELLCAVTANFGEAPVVSLSPLSQDLYLWLDHAEDVNDILVEVAVPEEPTEPERFLDVASRIIHGERNEQYGHPYHDFGVISAFWSAFLGVDIDRKQVAALMVLLKMARLSHNIDHVDSWVDTAGYVGCADRLQRFADGWEGDELPSAEPEPERLPFLLTVPDGSEPTYNTTMSAPIVMDGGATFTQPVDPWATATKFTDPDIIASLVKGAYTGVRFTTMDPAGEHGRSYYEKTDDGYLWWCDGAPSVVTGDDGEDILGEREGRHIVRRNTPDGFWYLPPTT